MTKHKKNIKRQHFLQLVLVIIIIVIINVISDSIFTRFDLTNEKRYTLSDATKKTLKNLDDIVYFKVYLDGEFPAGFKRLRRETKELLDEFRAFNKNIEYEFINPSISESEQERNFTYQLLVEQGLTPTSLQVKTKNGLEQQVIFPGMIVAYREKELPVELLDAQINVPPEAVLNNSIQNLEFKFVNAIHLLTRSLKPRIAFIKGHGEVDEMDAYDLNLTLKQDYIVDRVKIDEQINALVKRILVDSAMNKYELSPRYDAIVIAKPDSVFSSKDKFIIDQYIMHGGKVLWLIDQVLTSMDSIQSQESTVAVSNNLNLDDLIFKYGVRMNYNLVMDLNAMPIAIRTGQVGGQPQLNFFPWYYFPVITPISQHPIVKNLNAIKTQFVGSIDTVRAPGIRKTVLLKTSPYSRTVNTPAVISLGIIRQQPDESLYRGPSKITAVLMEGEFESFYRNRIPPEIANANEIGFSEYSKYTSMIFVSDGDMIRNQFRIPGGEPLPLGYDQYTRETFGNKDFILNAINYLVEGPELINLRTRELSLRLLDQTRVNNNKLQWQLINLLLPILLIALLGSILVWLRKQKYSR